MTEIEKNYQPLNKAILAIKEEIGSMYKDTLIDNGTGRNYSVVGYEQIIAKLQPLFLKYGINVFPHVVSADSWDTYRDVVSAAGVVTKVRESHFAKVVVDYVLNDTTGVEKTVRMVGEAENDNDKAMSAALSFAWKYFAKQTFDLVTGDPDPDTVGRNVGGYVERSSSPTPPAVPTPPAAPAVTSEAPPALITIGGVVVSESVTSVFPGATEVGTQPATRPPAAPQTQPVLQGAVQGNKTSEGVELVSDSQRSLISVILTGKTDPQYPNNQNMKPEQAYDFVEAVIGRPLNRKVHFKRRFEDITKEEAQKVMNEIKKIPGVNLPDRQRQ